MNVLNLEHISKIYGEKKVLMMFPLVVHEATIGVIGINGTGKTTLLKMIAGLEIPDEGKVIRRRGFGLLIFLRIRNFRRGRMSFPM